MSPDPDVTVLHHGTTLRRARLIEANGPDAAFREPNSTGLPPAQGFSAVVADGRPCYTGTPEEAAIDKDALFPEDGGPAILEVGVPNWIMDILYADPVGNMTARGGEIRFYPESGLNELQAEWPNLEKRVIQL